MVSLLFYWLDCVEIFPIDSFNQNFNARFWIIVLQCSVSHSTFSSLTRITVRIIFLHSERKNRSNARKRESRVVFFATYEPGKSGLSIDLWLFYLTSRIFLNPRTRNRTYPRFRSLWTPIVDSGNFYLNGETQKTD